MDSRVSVLALDTAGPEPGVALVARDEYFEESLPSDRQASERLLPAVHRVLERAGLALRECGRIAVCSGPGSFTGLRIGLSTAWAIGRALEVPVEEVSTLEALAEAVRSQAAGIVTTALDAGRSEVVIQDFSLREPRARGLSAPRRIPREEAAGLPGPLAALPAGLLGSPSLAPRSSLSLSLALAVAASPRNGLESPGGRKPLAIYSRPSAAEEKRGAS
jgi:tRNA threonylcarbamoyladenosine biosynthesis protein TsaB